MSRIVAVRSPLDVEPFSLPPGGGGETAGAALLGGPRHVRGAEASGYGGPTRCGGQYVRNTGPISSLRATVPQSRESHELRRLSPIMK